MQHIQLGNISIDVEQKDIKNIHLSVYPPNGKVKIAAPERMELDTIRVFAINKLKWIKKQQKVFKNQERETKREFLESESHYFQGKRYLLSVIEQETKPKVILKHSVIELYIRPNTSTKKRKEILDEWYREEMKKEIPKMLEKWEQEGVSLILGEEKSNLLVEANDEGNVLDLNKPVAKPMRADGQRNQYDSLFE